MRHSRITTLILILVVTFALGLAACQPEQVEVTRLVEGETVVETVTEMVEVTRIVEGETVTEMVEVEVTATPTPKGGQLVIGTNKFPTGMDPHVNVAWEVLYTLSAVYDTLVYQDQDGNFVPGLAESWEVSEDGTTYTFTLRDDVTFHDGTPFNAEAVQFNFERMVDPDTASQKAASLLGPYESSEVIDDYTIQVSLSEPYSFLLEGLSLNYTAMVSPAAVEEWGDEYQLHQVGTGPFIFQEFDPESHMTLVPNPDYAWGPEIFENQGPPHLEEVRWIFLPEPAARLPALEAGDVQMALSFPPSDSSQLLSRDNLDLRITPLVGQPLYWFMNTQVAPTDDIAVRQAILYGTDRQTAVNIVLRGMYPVANGPLSAVSKEYDPGTADMITYDPEMARQILEDAGWTDTDGDGIREKDGQDLTISMILQGWGFIGPLGEVVQAQLREIGINVEAEQMSFGAMIEAAGNNERNMAVLGGSGFFAHDSLFSYFHSSNAEGGFNWSKVQSPELDALLEQGASALDEAERSQAYAEAQEMIMEQALILPIYDYVFITGLNSRLQDVKWSRIGLIPYLNDAYMEE